MNWYSLAEKLGLFVWLAYGLVVISFSILVIDSHRRLKKIKKQRQQKNES